MQHFYMEGWEEKACSTTLTQDDFIESRNNCYELSSTELDILGIIQSSLNCNGTSISGRVAKDRQHPRMTYFYDGKRICLKTFLFLHCLSNFRFYSLVKHYRKNGLALRTHGNSKRLPSSSSPAETVEQVIKFINNVAEEQALLLPGRVPSFKRTDVKLLPSNLTKRGLWSRYSDICTNLYKRGKSVCKCKKLANKLYILYFIPSLINAVFHLTLSITSLMISFACMYIQYVS